jgi:fructose-1-phosphate kinase PfkB-like protein
MMAALPLGNDRGDDWLNTVKKASAVGSASVMTAGTETVPPDAVQELESRVIVEELPLA